MLIMLINALQQFDYQEKKVENPINYSNFLVCQFHPIEVIPFNALMVFKILSSFSWLL